MLAHLLLFLLFLSVLLFLNPQQLLSFLFLNSQQLLSLLQFLSVLQFLSLPQLLNLLQLPNLMPLPSPYPGTIPPSRETTLRLPPMLANSPVIFLPRLTHI